MPAGATGTRRTAARRGREAREEFRAWKRRHRWGRHTGSGNVAFDEYREETLRKLDEEQREFRDFLDRLRAAKDRAEFDDFMAERRNRRRSPSRRRPRRPRPDLSSLIGGADRPQRRQRCGRFRVSSPVSSAGGDRPPAGQLSPLRRSRSGRAAPATRHRAAAFGPNPPPCRPGLPRRPVEIGELAPQRRTPSPPRPDAPSTSSPSNVNGKGLGSHSSTWRTRWE